MSFDNKLDCEVCSRPVASPGIIDGIKLTKMNGEDRIEWIENKLGRSIPNKELFFKYCEDGLREFHRKKELERINKRFDAYAASPEYIPKCPICGSSNIKRISMSTRVVKSAAFGTIGALDDAGKTWKCSNCGSKF